MLSSLNSRILFTHQSCKYSFFLNQAISEIIPSHIREAPTQHYIHLFDSIHSSAIRYINDPDLSAKLLFLGHKGVVGYVGKKTEMFFFNIFVHCLCWATSSNNTRRFNVSDPIGTLSPSKLSIEPFAHFLLYPEHLNSRIYLSRVLCP